jgi:hypothetical protein
VISEHYLPNVNGCIPRSDSNASTSTQGDLSRQELLWAAGAAEVVAGRRVSIRIEVATLMVFDPDTRELLRPRPNPLSYDPARKVGYSPSRSTNDQFD